MSPDSLKTKSSVTDVCLLKIFTKMCIVHVCPSPPRLTQSTVTARECCGVMCKCWGDKGPRGRPGPRGAKVSVKPQLYTRNVFTVEHREHISRFNRKNSSLHETEQQVRGLDCRRAGATDAFCALASSHSNMKAASEKHVCTEQLLL